MAEFQTRTPVHQSWSNFLVISKFCSNLPKNIIQSIPYPSNATHEMKFDQDCPTGRGNIRLNVWTTMDENPSPYYKLTFELLAQVS